MHPLERIRCPGRARRDVGLSSRERLGGFSVQGVYFAEQAALPLQMPGCGDVFARDPLENGSRRDQLERAIVEHAARSLEGAAGERRKGDPVL